MGLLFTRDEWVKAAMQEVNQSEAHKAAAKSWEGDPIFVISAVPGDRKEVRLNIDLWHGERRDAYEITDSQDSEFFIAAPLPVWRKVLERNLDAIPGLVSRQLKMKGNKMKVMSP